LGLLPGPFLDFHNGVADGFQQFIVVGVFGDIFEASDIFGLAGIGQQFDPAQFDHGVGVGQHLSCFLLEQGKMVVKDYAHADRVFFESDIGEKAASILDEHGILLLSWHESGMQGFYNSKRPIEKIQDIKGMTMRTMESPTIAAAMNAYGARSIPMAFPEFYSAMQTGVVDGGENGIYAYYVAKHYEVAPYYTVTNHRYLTSAFLMSTKTWKRIPDKYKELVKKTALESSLYGIGEGRKTEDARYEEVQKKFGTKLNIMSEEAKADFRKAVEKLYKQVGKKTGMQELLDEIIALRDK